MEYFASKESVRKYPRGRRSPEYRPAIPPREKQDAGRVSLRPRMGKSRCLKPPPLVRHPPEPQTPTLVGWELWGMPRPALLPPQAGNWPGLGCPGNQRPPGSPASSPPPPHPWAPSRVGLLSELMRVTHGLSGFPASHWHFCSGSTSCIVIN